MDLYKKALELIEADRPFALAAVIHAAGPTPQKSGAKAIFDPRGPVLGTLGGGCLEAESRRRALDALDEGKPLVFDLKLDEVDGWDDELICGGKVRIFVNPDTRSNAECYRTMLAARGKGERGALVTIIRHPEYEPGRALWISSKSPDEPPGETPGETPGDIPGGVSIVPDPTELRKLMAQETAGTIRAERAGDSSPIEVFVEPVVKPPQLIIAGGGHIGRATAHLAALMGFEVTVIDDRPAFANAEHIPEAHRTICGDIAKEIAAQPITDKTYIVIVTRGHRHDAEALAACIDSPAAYIGVIGSRRKSRMVRKRLVAEAVATEEQMARVLSPIGLDLGARSVEEIALSITSQLVAVRRGRAEQARALALSS